MSDTPVPMPSAVCRICGEMIQAGDEAVITATSILHVACIEQSAAAA